MSLYEWHHLLFDWRSNTEVKVAYLRGREAVYQCLRRMREGLGYV